MTTFVKICCVVGGLAGFALGWAIGDYIFDKRNRETEELEQHSEELLNKMVKDALDEERRKLDSNFDWTCNDEG